METVAYSSSNPYNGRTFARLTAIGGGLPHRVKNLGYEIEPQVGVEGFFIDIGIRHPDCRGEFLMGLECDGSTYHSSPSVRDRDRLRQEILESKGWFIHRIWSTSWFHARTAEIDRLAKAIKQRLEADRRMAPPLPEEQNIQEPRGILTLESRRHWERRDRQHVR